MSVIKITFTDATREGVSAKGNAYIFQEAFIHVDDKPFPLQCQLFVNSVFRPGDYVVPYGIAVNQGRPELNLDLAKAKVVS